MNNYTWKYIEKHPKEVKRLLGIDYEQLEQLIEQGKILHQIKQESIEKHKTRIIKAGGGKPAKLLLEEQIILTIIYLRHNLTFQVLGLLFQVSESTAHNLFNYWQDLLREGLPSSLLEQIKKSQENEETVLEQLEEYELIVDSEEQDITRPSEYQIQKKYYSGKKKSHTFKNQFIVLPSGKDIVDVVVGRPGPVSDINLCRERLKLFHPQQKLIGDKAYIGEAQIRTPDKKPKNQELTELQKEQNKILSSQRIFVEHVIRIVKIFKVAQERFRLKKDRYSEVLLTICGLVRLRKGSLILEIVENANFDKTIEVMTRHSFGKDLLLATSNT
ncbi:MAG: transposase [Xenococcaceae cyanobacterium MO_188.B19]|nr:transposase [Xenococcaceae cyanobacterium MO_188.B19]